MRAQNINDYVETKIAGIKALKHKITGEIYLSFREITCYGHEMYPGEFQDYHHIVLNTQFHAEKVKVWYKNRVYVHLEDVRNYVLARQGHIEAHTARMRGHKGGWCERDAKAIYTLLGIKVSVWNKLRTKDKISKETIDTFKASSKLRTIWQLYSRHKGFERMLVNQPGAWKTFVETLKKESAE